MASLDRAGADSAALAGLGGKPGKAIRCRAAHDGRDHWLTRLRRPSGMIEDN
jgi:hypothetical protein